MKIPFDIKYRPQIENDEYKVETRDGRPARIICWDMKSEDENSIVALVDDGACELGYSFKNTGRYWISCEDELDLFIITPEPELAESEDERIRKRIINILGSNTDAHEEGWAIYADEIAWLEKQKEQKHAECNKESKDKPILTILIDALEGNAQLEWALKKAGVDVKRLVTYIEEQKPAECDKETDVQKAFREGQNAGRQEVFDNPGAYGLEKIDNVFGFRIGDVVRLVDGDGRPHIIKHFEKIEGLHGPNFYRVRFEDNTASDHIIPGDEYPNGYFTCMEKIDEQKEKKPIISAEESLGISQEEYNKIVDKCIYGDQKEQKSIEDFVKDITKNKEAAIKFLRSAGIMDDNGELTEMYRSEQNPAELPKSEDYGIDGLYAAIDILQKTLGEVDGYQTDDGILEHKCAISAVKELYKQKPEEWSEEDERNFYWISTTIQERHLTPEYTQQVHKILSWLKSLRPQPHWKPSEEQMEALKTVYEYFSTSTPTNVKMSDILRRLYNDLKKL